MLRTNCPICDKPMVVRQLADWPAFPFCSSRCRTIDLGRWLGQDYRIHGTDGLNADQEQEATQDISAQ